AGTGNPGQSRALAQATRVWGALEVRAEGIAVIPPDTRTSGRTLVLFFEGDVPDEDMAPARMSKIVAAYQRPVTEAQSQFGLPFIVVARPGLMGSSGFHLIGGLRAEGEVMNNALDAIKQRDEAPTVVTALQAQ